MGLHAHNAICMINYCVLSASQTQATWSYKTVLLQRGKMLSLLCIKF